MKRPMTAEDLQTSYTQHHQKTVFEERRLDDMRDSRNWELKSSPAGYGHMEKCERDGCGVLRLTSDVITDIPSTSPGRGWGSVTLYRSFEGEDWHNFNRIALEVYPDLPGFRTVSLCMYLVNKGAMTLPAVNGHMGLHFVVLRNQQWNHVYWEIPDLGRDKVMGIGLQYRLQGAEPGTDRTVTYDFSNLRLQRVDADHVRGWEPKDGEICFSHTGYTPDSQKTAIASGLTAETFEVIRCCDGLVSFSGSVQNVEVPLGRFQVLDFSSLADEGRYFLRTGDKVTRPFAIGKDVWKTTIEKTMNFFYTERCGYPVPGVHDICHADLRGRHEGFTKVLNGGWHDAGDLSQGLINSAEAAYAMMALARSVREKDTVLYETILDEARWGQDWVLKTRFWDGFRVSWQTMDYWSDGVEGNIDDATFDATRRAYDNFVSAASEALAAQVWAQEDASFALRNLKAAREDFIFADMDRDTQPGGNPIGVYSQGVLAAVELYRATGCGCYLDKAVDYADTVVACQQTEYPDWETPIRGFFFTDGSHKTILHFPHRGHEQAPMAALHSLLKAAPGHANAAKWLRCIKLYGEYIRAVTKYTAPYGMLPASIYSLDEVTDKNGRSDSFDCPTENAVAQIKNGIRLSPTHYLRRFPVWYNYRGNSGTTLSQACGVLECALALKDRELLEICRRALEWHVGRNPFNQSLIWGEGYNYSTRYTAMCGDIVGSFPVGIQAQYDEDIPYFPDSNCYTYKEVWVHPASRWLWLMGTFGQVDF